MSVRILHGDVRERLVDLPDDSVDCIVTSPPYYGLRDYGVAEQIGLEPTLGEYLDTLVAVCRDLRRVLKPSGTFWLNVGDAYAGGGRGGNPGDRPHVKQRSNQGSIGVPRQRGRLATGLKPKDLMMVPNRLAIALQDDGWWVRSEIIWHKLNPMPENVGDRPTCCHEKVWLLTKGERYWYDAEAIAEPANYPPGCGWDDAKRGAFAGKGTPPGSVNREAFRAIRETRNARNVWAIASAPFSEAHFATFPPDLAKRCIKAGCPAGGHVLDPFGGAGTTAMVADRLGRDATLIELNPAYIDIARLRIEGDARMFAELECA